MVNRWEYKVIRVQTISGNFILRPDPSIMERELNELGQQGWELVSTAFLLRGFVLCSLKRPCA